MRASYILIAALCLLALFIQPIRAEEESQEVEVDTGASASAVSAGSARLLVQKQLDHHATMPYNFPILTPINVTITVVNIGDAAAYDVNIADEWLSGFELSGPSAGQNKWDKIEAGQSVTVSYFVTPNQEGEFESAPARVTYLPTENGMVMTGYSSSATNLNVVSAEQFAKLTNTHVIEWSIFGGVFALFLLAPLGKYYELQSSFVKGGRRKAE